MAACMIMPPRRALAGAHFEKHNHQLYAAKMTALHINSDLFFILMTPSQYMLLE
jgi:hypothetical protein